MIAARPFQHVARGLGRNAFDLPVCVQNPLGIRVTTGYDKLGRPVSTQNGMGFVSGSLPFKITPPAGFCDPSVTASPHTGSMLVALGDGSVRTVSPSVSVTTWKNACIPDDGNPLGSDW